MGMRIQERTNRYGIAVGLAAAGLLGGAAARREASATTARVLDDPGVRVVADLSQRKLRVMDGDSAVLTFAIAIGKGSKPTPRGHYSIGKIVWNPAWVPPDEAWAKNKTAQPPGAKDNPMKLVKIFFQEPDYYIHGTSEVESLGEAASHGCLRMDPDDAYRVARYLMEHGGQPRDESWFQRILHFRDQTQTVYLDHAIPMTVTE
jgi:lipoprotein-anchoring transpeptidase ErfK/SrfK